MTNFLPSNNMDRRQFLALCALAATPGALVACQPGASSGAGAATEAPRPSPTKPPTPTDADWARLAGSLRGQLVRPNSLRYGTALQLFNTRFDTIHPTAIAYCASVADVQNVLAFVRRFNLPVAPRAGGHSYAGYSTTTGVVLDVTRINGVAANVGAATATIGGGARLIDVYSALASRGLALPGGSCPTVGVAGLTQGGGVGVLGRKFGLTSDNLLSAQVVLADGSVLTCDANHNADLFWGLRGGGGGNFGVVTSFTFRVHPVSGLAIFGLSWPWSSAAAVVDAWQNWAPHTPDELWSNCLLLSSDDRNAAPQIRVGGVYVGTVAGLSPLLQQLQARIPVAPISQYAYNETLLDTMLIEAGCYGKTIAQCHLPAQNPAGQLQRDTSAARSDYFTRALSRRGIDILVRAISQRQSSPVLGNGGIGLDAYGGALNRVPADATAFVHRNALFSAQYTAGWHAGAPRSTVSANRAWLDQLWQSLRPYASGFAYQNYIDPELTNWQQAYYGSNFARLRQIKGKYDPHNLFHFAQSIPV